MNAYGFGSLPWNGPFSISLLKFSFSSSFSCKRNINRYYHPLGREWVGLGKNKCHELSACPSKNAENAPKMSNLPAIFGDLKLPDILGIYGIYKGIFGKYPPSLIFLHPFQISRPCGHVGRVDKNGENTFRIDFIAAIISKTSP